LPDQHVTVILYDSFLQSQCDELMVGFLGHSSKASPTGKVCGNAVSCSAGSSPGRNWFLYNFWPSDDHWWPRFSPFVD